MQDFFKTVCVSEGQVNLIGILDAYVHNFTVTK